MGKQEEITKRRPLRSVALALPVVLATLLMAAHFLRWGDTGLAITGLASIALLLLRRRWVPPVLTLGLLAGSVVWIDTVLDLVQLRQSLGAPWVRAAIIVGSVALLTAAAPLVFRAKTFRERFARGAEPAWVGAAAFLLTLALLVPVQVVVERPILLLERFWPGGGPLEMFGLAVYAALMSEVLLDPRRLPTWRLRIWLLFSIVFFGQLFLGLAGLERLLMTGELHLPIPAVIIAGPIYRGGGLFMVILFSATLLLVGPAWCSYLCYFGAWDGVAAGRQRRPNPLPAWARTVRRVILVVVVAVAWLLNQLGVDGWTAAVLALGFAAGGIAVIALASRRAGTMVHCTVYCPLGLLADVLGKVSPFRIRIGEGCTECGACTKACRYDALSSEQVRSRRPGLTCSLCGDCVDACREGQIAYQLLGLRHPWVRSAFLVLVVALHTVFLGVARV